MHCTIFNELTKSELETKPINSTEIPGVELLDTLYDVKITNIFIIYQTWTS